MAQQQDPTKFVNVFIGTGGHGHTFPGPTLPFGMVQLSPDTRMDGWDACGGYYYDDNTIYGFSHTHLSGTGCADYGDLLLMPTLDWECWKPEVYLSHFSHSSEQANPGYYEVMLDKYQIKAELTATARTGLHRYTFPQKSSFGNILIDLKHGISDEVSNSWIKLLDDSTVIGLRESNGWARDQILYFAIRFSKPISHYSLALNDTTEKGIRYLKGKNVKAEFGFNFQGDGNQTVEVKVGLSAVSAENALKNLIKEQPGFNFKKISTEANLAWKSVLKKIDVEGGSVDEKTIFYTALYHSYLSPNLYQDVDSSYRGTDLKVHQAKNFTNYTVFSLWDTYRAFHPLMTILEPQKTADWINTFLVQYKYGGMMPIWELSANENYCMIGHHSVPVITDAYAKGIRGFDAQYALEAMENYDESKRFALPAYRKQGYLDKSNIGESVSRTIEYSYDDWCIAQMASLLNDNKAYTKYINRAQSYKNVFDSQSGFFRSRNKGHWNYPFSPIAVNGDYTEADAWQYNFAVQQDVSEMIRLNGGVRKFAEKLDTFFTTSSSMTGNVPPDISGMIGQYAHGNEPSHHIAYLYNYIGQPEQTQTLIHKILTTLYRNNPDGESGNDDCGQMSAWFVMSALGFYQVCPGIPEYAIGSPLFKKIRINLSHDRKFEIEAQNLSATNIHISEATLNGKPYNKSFITHKDILRGGKLVLFMSKEPGKKFGKAPSTWPVAGIAKKDQCMPVPFVKQTDDSSKLELSDIEPNAIIYYTINGSEPTENSLKYSGPFKIKTGMVIKAKAFGQDKLSSKILELDY